MRKYDLISSTVLTVCFILVIINSSRLPLGTLNHPGSGFFPLLVGILTVILSGILFIQSFLQSPSQRKELFGGHERRLHKSVSTVLALLAYGIFLNWLGFLCVTFLLMFFLLKVIGSQGWKLSLGMAISITFSAYLLFKVFLKLQLPAGPWGM
jgi:hypothetical protein